MTPARVVSAALTVAGPAGDLEAALDQVPEVDTKFACVVCHPNPQQRGTMQNKVVTTVSRAAARLGGCSLRFNYRGVGASHGAFDEGRGELDDALAAVAHLRALPQCAGLPLVIAGFSFGGAIAYRAALVAQPTALVTVAPAHERVPADSRAGLARWLLIQGDDDEIIPAPGVLQWAAQHAPAPQIERFESTGHFFHGKLPRLTEVVSSYLHQTML